MRAAFPLEVWVDDDDAGRISDTTLRDEWESFVLSLSGLAFATHRHLHLKCSCQRIDDGEHISSVDEGEEVATSDAVIQCFVQNTHLHKFKHSTATELPLWAAIKSLITCIKSDSHHRERRM